ncbi:hypothetical protein NCG97_00210 [Streptomyces lydicamycinicus]|uniref:hypothetical protein n=1 Tax=Streptomyces lydicamycinicus TaxID=1546107 RepID=UPI002035DB68|nr:hypothetical protein [Streptomyces lydicamycinicus]URZ99446.1 hypothetical protein NCG97_00210 [Streptomyces lydicamycinicus]
MDRIDAPEERRLAELLAMLPGWDDKQFWDQVDEITGGVTARGTMNALLRSATNSAADGTYFTSLLSVAEEVLERYARPVYREQLASLIGAQLILGGGDKTALGCRWLDDAADAAWQIHVSSQYDGSSPFDALRQKWDLPS